MRPAVDMRALLLVALAACEMEPPPPRPTLRLVDVVSAAPTHMQVIDVIAREYGTERRIPGLTVRIRDLRDCPGREDTCPPIQHSSAVTGGDGTAHFELPYPQYDLAWDVEAVGKNEGYATHCPFHNHSRAEKKYALQEMNGSTYVCHLVPFSSLAVFEKQGAIRAAKRLPDVQRWLAKDPHPAVVVEDMADAEWLVTLTTDDGSREVVVDAIDGSALVRWQWDDVPGAR
ncbi:MAG TPA: hypothetical protein VLB44_15160 [Kofleriaceae bacterium]|nr:hypothetical protein [Kofleriaceae bacterium]